ncbi:hypothetical protein SDC9_65352 [bioreactor metagenome]|uniref:Uncharacterized protein n=1 Tax=bioreactor metagenome TaxID=1076179 RepID=A0A644XY14_9ZZZZ
MLALGVDTGVDHLLQKAYPQHAHLLQRQLKGSNRSIPELGEVTVVEADHSYLVRNMDVHFLEC